ncbi:hypothetical protein [Flavobacterium sp. CS20]|uniref:hypothetical protein n=1 Tax=Flavobacterium sp. CS20 TaxID=2775246 RepID=UPI001B39E230|nr:hypothetical protein [Flavobacterium sp. CS20]QTY25966.1 hypothetical protein IGB25_08050 [Flavobacterium sp. CS20]
MKINEIWDELAKDISTQGLIIRRYSTKVLPDIYIALQQPEKLLGICVSLDKHTEVNISEVSNLQEIQLSYVNSPLDRKRKS